MVANEKILNKYLPEIKKKVSMSRIKDCMLYNIYGEYYEFEEVKEGKWDIKFIFKHAFNSKARLQCIKCHKILKVVLFNSFTGDKYKVSAEEKKQLLKIYNHNYYTGITVNKRNEKRQKKKRICIVCGKEFTPKGNQTLCSEECKKLRRKQWSKEYAETHREQITITAKKWRKNNPDKVKEIERRYHKSEKFKAVLKRYHESKKGKLAIKRNNEKKKLLDK